MKRVKIILSVLFLCMVLPAVRGELPYGYEVDFKYNDIGYRILSEEERTVQALKVYGYQGRYGEVIVPDSVEADRGYYYVTDVSFYDSWFVSLKLPATVKVLLKQFTGRTVNVYISSLEQWLNLETTYWGNYESAGNFNLYIGDTLLENLVLPDSLESLPSVAFANVNSLKSVTFPSSLRDIGRRAFYGCNDLSKVTFNEGLTTIGEDAFNGCYALSSIDLPSTLRVIEDRAFSDTEISEVRIPEGVYHLSGFSGCRELRSINIPGTVVEMGPLRTDDESFVSIYVLGTEVICGFEANVFTSETYLNTTVYVPVGTKEFYEQTPSWKNFWNIVESSTVGIAQPMVKGNAREVARYDMDGRMLMKPQGGINIVRLSDGTSRKVMVR